METARQVRHAMGMAIDRQALVDAIVGRHGRPTYVYMLLGYFADRYMQPEWEVP
jgi:ABC-type transport system substrate-binding protein